MTDVLDKCNIDAKRLLAHSTRVSQIKTLNIYIYIHTNFYGFHFDYPSYISYHTFSLHKPAVYMLSVKAVSEMEATLQYIILSTVYGQNGYLETIKNKKKYS